MRDEILNRRDLVKLAGLLAVGLGIVGCAEHVMRGSDEGFLDSVRTQQGSSRGKPDVAENVRFIAGAVFGSVDGRDLAANIFTREKLPFVPRPAIVFLHGGS